MSAVLGNDGCIVQSIILRRARYWRPITHDGGAIIRAKLYKNDSEHNSFRSRSTTFIIFLSAPPIIRQRQIAARARGRLSLLGSTMSLLIRSKNSRHSHVTPFTSGIRPPRIADRRLVNRDRIEVIRSGEFRIFKSASLNAYSSRVARIGPSEIAARA